MLRIARNLLLLLLCSLLGNQAIGQVYFDLLDDYSGWTERSSNPILLEDTIYWTSAGYDFLGNNGTHLSFLKITQQGTIITKDVESAESGRYAAGSICAMGDSAILCLTSFNFENSSSDYFQHRLSAFETSGNLLWQHTYEDSGYTNTPNQVIACNSGFLIVGQRYHAVQGDSADMKIVKVDNQGQLEWDLVWGGSNYESAYSATQTTDGGYLILGWTRSFGSGQRDIYLLKIDSAGTQQWHQTYGGNENESGLSILELNDGNFLLTGAGANYSGTGSIGIIYKVDISGQVIWTQTYGHPGNGGNNLWKSLELNNGSLVHAGLTDQFSNSGWLLKTDGSGGIIWSREYDYNQFTDLFYSVLQTGDNGFVMSGQAMNESTASQDAWLLKVDSIGCPYPNCTVGIDELGSKDVLLDVWPNPANDVLNLEVAGNYTSAPVSVTVVDMQGRVVCKDQDCHGRSSLAMTGKTEIDVSNWPNGLYVLTLTTDKQRASVRVVVQH